MSHTPHGSTVKDLETYLDNQHQLTQNRAQFHEAFKQMLKDRDAFIAKQKKQPENDILNLGVMIATTNKHLGTTAKYAQIKTPVLSQVNFTYEYPLIYLDFVDLVFGDSLINKLYNFEFPATYHVMINPECQEMMSIKAKIHREFFPLCYMIFEKLGEIDYAITSQ